ncbi:MAG: glycoside hydrolase family 130 protein [Bacteroidales bacterium]|nr:glycoside hydrolase family 130 protein [Bacteroidales bacterium]
MLRRHANNPIIKPSTMTPSVEGYNILGAFNPGATIYNNQIILLMRVSENCPQEKKFINIPYYSFVNNKSEAKILHINKDDPQVTLKDTRGVFYKGKDYLSTISHLRLARSYDGINFTIDKKPFIAPSNETEKFGVEDARISKIDDTYYINYTGVSEDGYATMLATTKNFIDIERKGVIFAPLNKDVAIFEEKVNGKYIALHRPDNHGFGLPSIWYADSPDIIHWGNHKCLLRPDGSKWESQKIGAGAAPIKTKEGWLVLYHGKGDNSIYSLNLLLLDINDPSKIIKRCKQPIFTPKEDYEKNGFFGNVIFSNGIVTKPDGTIFIYYGACDETVCLATTTIDELLNLLKNH